MWTRTEIIKLEDITTEIDKQPVNDMYRIVVTAFYDNFGQTGEMTAETIRYAKLYSATGAAAGSVPSIPLPR